MLALTRPELYERQPGWGSGVRSATSVTLEPLPDPVMRELLHGLAAGLPESLVTAVCERAGGIPLYAVETVRMLIDRGQLVPAGDGYALVEVPTSSTGWPCPRPCTPSSPRAWTRTAPRTAP